MKEIKLYNHTGSGNHGCEAIIRSTVKMLNQPVKLYSYHIDEDKKYGIDKICELIEDKSVPMDRGSIKWFFAKLQTKLTGSINIQIKECRKSIIKNIHQGDVFLSVGGDNYCYPGTDILGALNYNIKRKGAKLVLWGCSVEPEVIKDKNVAKDLRKFNLITARESISYNALRKINNNTIFAADPAFTLEKIEKPLPIEWKKGNTIGINISPLIISSGKNSEVVLTAYKKLIFYILDKTDCSIALIPHVVWENNDDRKTIELLKAQFSNSKRVFSVNDSDCRVLKGYISRCRMFIGARTHAIIAAYSTCVPTLALGYSVKSKGIAKDLFGTYSNYVLPVQMIETSEELVDRFKWLLENEDKIRSLLKKIIPEYIEQAYTGSQKLQMLLKS